MTPQSQVDKISPKTPRCELHRPRVRLRCGNDTAESKCSLNAESVSTTLQASECSSRDNQIKSFFLVSTATVYHERKIFEEYKRRGITKPNILLHGVIHTAESEFANLRSNISKKSNSKIFKPIYQVT